MSFSIFLGLDNFLEEREIEDVQIIRDLCSSDRFFLRYTPIQHHYVIVMVRFFSFKSLSLILTTREKQNVRSDDTAWK